MEKQLIISVGREFGSGGHVIAEKLADRFGLELFDNNLLAAVAEEKDVMHHTIEKYDEKPKNKLLSRTVRGHSNSPQEHVANMQFEYLKKMASEGRSFVVVGRCAETMLKENPALVSIFILGDRKCKLERIKEKYHLSEEEARQLAAKKDMKRKLYHNGHCKGKWGDSRTYDLTINSSRLGIDRTVDILEQYIRERLK